MGKVKKSAKKLPLKYSEAGVEGRMWTAAGKYVSWIQQEDCFGMFLAHHTLKASHKLLISFWNLQRCVFILEVLCYILVAQLDTICIVTNFND